MGSKRGASGDCSGSMLKESLNLIDRRNNQKRKLGDCFVVGFFSDRRAKTLVTVRDNTG